MSTTPSRLPQFSSSPRPPAIGPPSPQPATSTSKCPQQAAVPVSFSSVTPGKKKLLDEVRDCLRLNHYALRTEEAYVQWIRRFILFHNKRHPMEMGETEINGFLSHLARDRHVRSRLTKWWSKSPRWLTKSRVG